MNQVKIGAFLKELRKEKGMTQEQFAEVLGVSGRTISRWETGSNMPDLDMLIQLADYYEVDIREILDGERKSENMDHELKETLLKIADYSNDEKKKETGHMLNILALGVITFTIYIIMDFIGFEDTVFKAAIKGAVKGFSYGAMLWDVLYTSRIFAKVKALKIRLSKKKQ